MDFVRASVAYTAVRRFCALVEAVTVTPAVVAVVNSAGIVTGRMVSHIAVEGAVSAGSREITVVFCQTESLHVIILSAITA